MIGVVKFLLFSASALALAPPAACSRRWLIQQASLLGITAAATPSRALAAADCYTDCFKNCELIAPKSVDYCKSTCVDYCQQPDRQDGLSGSVSAASGEVGILGGSFGQGTVVKDQDKPPVINLPGLDFSSTAGKKLIGY
jgi:hypothetical protein